MQKNKVWRLALSLCAVAAIAGCGVLQSGNGASQSAAAATEQGLEASQTTASIWELFNRKETENTVLVNKYLWSASLEVLSFLPVQSVDPFTGVIVTGFGTPPGGGRAYRATVLIDDPALDARSLNVALQSRGGPVSKATSRAVEDAILSRARELRIKDNRF